MRQTDAKLLLLDSKHYSSALLQEELQRRGFASIFHCDPSGDLKNAVTGFDPDVVIFNHHYENQNDLAVCAAIKQLAPSVPVVAIASSGPAVKLVSARARETRQIDVVIEKPLSDERFFMVVGDLAAARQSVRQQQFHLARLSNLVPAAALEAMKQHPSGEAEMFEAAVLFTDIRRSTEMIASLRPEAYFAALNRSLSEQTRALEAGHGTVVKYTGDGVLAVFRGMGRSRLALRCAQILAGHETQKPLPFGVGLAHGLILGGFVGDFQQAGRRSQYDVIGSTVHLAARLCSLASPGEVIMTRSLQSAARFEFPNLRPIGPVAIRGFAQSVECVAFQSVPIN